MVWGITAALVALAFCWVVFRAFIGSNQQIRLNDYSDGLPIDLAAALHDHAMLLLEVQASVSEQSRSWKTIETLTDVAAALRFSIGIRTGEQFSIHDKGRYRSRLAFAVARLIRSKWSDEMDKHRAEQEAFRPFRLHGSISRGEYTESHLEKTIEEMANIQS